MSKTYYKVVRFHSDRLWSVWKNAAVEYKLNEWVFPAVEHSGLFIFDSWSASVGFVKKFYPWQQHGINPKVKPAFWNLFSTESWLRIYECEAENLSLLTTWAEFWDRIKDENKNLLEPHGRSSGSFMPGTVLADRVMLRRKCWPDNEVF